MNDTTMIAPAAARVGGRWLLAAAMLCAALLLGLGAARAQADFGFDPSAISASLSTTQAGAHPDLLVAYKTNRRADGSADGNLKDMKVSLPAGFSGKPTNFMQCSELQLLQAGGCPAASQVGLLTAHLLLGSAYFPVNWPTPLFNMKPEPGEAARFGAFFFSEAEYLTVKVRPGDYGLDTFSLSTTTFVENDGADVQLWGVPADHTGTGARMPFLTNPTSCGPLGPVAFKMSSWTDPTSYVTASAPLPAITGCDHLPALQPSASVAPGSSAPGEPSGYDVDLKVPQVSNPDGVDMPAVQAVKITLPQGTAISPPAANGLEACTDAQLGVGSADPATCPAASKVGTVTITTPDLAVPLTGSMYLGQPRPGDMYRLFLVASGPGVTLKLPGSARPDASTGQVVTMFQDLPDLPFSEMDVQLKGGSHALLTNPSSCGTYTATATLTPYGGGADATASSPFTIGDANCPATVPFGPQLSAGAVQPAAGAASPFVFRVTRGSGQQAMSTIHDVHLPAGLTAKVAGVPQCPDAAAAAGTCPDATQIGQAQIGSGNGPSPLYTPGKIFLTQGYKGAPFGMLISVPAIAGPYDLGTVNVRAAIRVNSDASLSIDADPMPTILDGVPLQMRDIALSFDRPGFMLNGTSCAPASIDAAVTSADGVTAPVSDRYQLVGCSGLGFVPRIVASTKAGNSSRRGAALHVAVAGRPGDANLRSVRFTLPKQIAARLSTVQGACPAASFAAGTCPAASKVGTATAMTPILPDALRGDAYLVAQDKALPKLMVTLNGDGISIPLTGDVTLARGRTTTTFDHLPDVPISRFDLDLPMGPHSALAATGNLCKASLVAPTRAIGQNGKVLDQHTRVHVDGCGRHAKAARSSAQG